MSLQGRKAQFAIAERSRWSEHRSRAADKLISPGGTEGYVPGVPRTATDVAGQGHISAQ